MADIVDFSGVTLADFSAEHVLRKALDAGLTEIVVSGVTEAGAFHFASSSSDPKSVLWLLEMNKREMFEALVETEVG